MMRVVFMGTPEFAVPSLEALAAAGYTIAGVITQPDRPVGRGHKLAPPPVKAKALELGLPVYQFERLRAQEGLDCLRALAPDVAVTAAFGQILSKKLLAVPKFGTVNVHASLLPRHRGAAPINWAIIQGDAVTGVETAFGMTYRARVVIVCSGVYLGSDIIVGQKILPQGPAGFPRANGLTESLVALGIEVRRFKTGTPARVHKDSVDLSALTVQRGEEGLYSFSALSKKVKVTAVTC